MTSQLYIGTSGYQYKHWDGWWYPEGINVSQKLNWHMGHFNALEINSSFYAIPKPERVEKWAMSFPPGKKLCLKAPQSVSHARRMKLFSDGNVRNGIDLLTYFLNGVHRIPEEVRGPILFQIPKAMEFAGELSMQRLRQLFFTVCEGHKLRLAFEIRNVTWLNRAVLDLFSQFNVALVEHDSKDLYVPYINTASWHYVRRHGTNGDYQGDYLNHQLERDYDRLDKLAKEVHVYFNNDGFAAAPKNACYMLSLAHFGALCAA